MVTAIAVLGLLMGEYKQHGALRAGSKMIAATGFIATALAVGALESSYGQTVLVALALSWLGDLLLLWRDEKIFLGGIGAFLLGHVAYAVAFFNAGISWPVFVGSAVLLALFGGVGHRWLSPHVAPAMRMPVMAYILVITIMVATALGTTAAQGRTMIAMGAIAFFVSDLSVARDRFVSPGFVNRLWGAPLYFGAQIILALTIRPA